MVKTFFWITTVDTNEEVNVCYPVPTLVIVAVESVLPRHALQGWRQLVW